MNSNDFKNNKNFKKQYKTTSKLRFKKRNKNIKIFRNFFILFLVIATFSYFACVISYSFLTREHVTKVKDLDSYVEENDNLNKNQEKIVKPVNNLKIDAIEVPTSLIFKEKQFKKLLKTVKQQGKNAVVVVLKGQDGNVLYDSEIYEAIEWGTIHKDAVDCKRLVETIKKEGLIPIAKISAFYDEKAPSAYRDNTFVSKDNEDRIIKFKDLNTKKQKPYLNPSSKAAIRYILRLIEEIEDFGFKKIIVSNLAFPPKELDSSVKGSDEIDRKDVLKKIIGLFKNFNNFIAIEYDFKLIKDYLEEEYDDEEADNNIKQLIVENMFGGNIANFGGKVYAPKLRSFNELQSFIKFVLKQKKKNKSIKFIPQLDFSKDLKIAKEQLKENRLDYSIILKEKFKQSNIEEELDDV